MSKEDGGPAFPGVDTEFLGDKDAPRVYSAGGMTLRDYFAAAALAGYMALPDDSTYATPNVQTLDEWRASARASAAKYCYAVADAMMKERAK